MDSHKHIPMTFAGGPTYMPPFLKSALQSSLFPTNQNDLSLFEINSNTKEFKDIVEAARSNIRDILNVPNNYQIWFLGGGAHLQFAGLGMNFLGADHTLKANYALTGYFSRLAFNEAKKFTNISPLLQLSKDENGCFYLPPPCQYKYQPNAVYTHFIDNQSVEGVQYKDEIFPTQQNTLLFDDCSSSFLTKSIPWQKVDMAYAHSQKNCGTSGLTIMVINDKCLNSVNPNPILPEVCSFQNYAKLNGYSADMNILPVFSNYISTKHIRENGGVNMHDYQGRADKLYEVIDKHKIYNARVRKGYRSRISVTWNIADQSILKKCIEEGEKDGLYEFKGHRSIGGLRASLFAPIPSESVYHLADFLQDFAQKYE